MYRRGIVTRTDPARARVRVRFPDADNVESWWLEVLQHKTHRDKAYWMPDVGEHVAVMMDEHAEAGCVLGALYSAADPAPANSQDKRHTRFDDGGWFEYDRASHTATINLPAAGKLRVVIGRSVLEITDAGWTVITPDVDWTVGG